jgi:hypothetical protein
MGFGIQRVFTELVISKAQMVIMDNGTLALVDLIWK